MMDGHQDGSEEGTGAHAGGHVIVVRRRSPMLWISLIALGVLIAVLVGAWTQRRPIAEHFIEQELARRGVRATYKIESIGLRNQVIRDVTIGDPANPDLTARYARIQMRILWNGSVEVYRIAARGVRLRGELRRGGKVSWGEIDKFLGPPSDKPFTLPDIAVDVADTRVALKTPFGNLGFALVGAGNLTGGFKGRLAVAGPQLVTGACELDSLHGNVAVAVEARRPHVTGPISAERFVCPDSRMAMISPHIDLDSGFSEAFGRFDGTGRLSVASLSAGDNGLANLSADIGFKGSATDVGGAIKLAAQRSRLGSIFADATRLNGRYRLWAGRGELALSADYGANSAMLAPAMVAPLIAPLESTKGTPLAAIGQSIAVAVRRTVGNFAATGHLSLVNLRGGGGVRIETADARSPSGGQVKVSGGDGVTYYWPSGRLRIDGNVATGGGGLPRADVRLRQPRLGGSMSGVARIAPYVAGSSRLALAPVTFRAGPGGSTMVNTLALLDGPFSGGFVRGLRIPINGTIGGNGGSFAFGRGCIDARFESLTAGALRLGAASVPICATGPAILYRNGPGSVMIGAATRNLRLAGSLGKSPFSLTAVQARLLGSSRFAASGLGLQLGRSASPVKITATTLTGLLANGGANGNFAGATALIGRVPIKLGGAVGKFNFHGGALALDGSSTVTDRDNPPRFEPLKSNDIHFRLANDLIKASGTLRNPGTGIRVTDVAITHHLSSGNGEAILGVPGIQFGNAIQPEQLTRLTEGVVALVNGNVRGQGRINWHGDASVTSTGDFSTDGTDLAATFGPVTGLKGTIHFTDLLGVQTAPGQTFTVASINPGILVENGVIHYQVLSSQLVKVERGEWPFMGGQLILQETVLNFAKSTPKRLTFEVVGFDSNAFVDTLEFKEIAATGLFDGVLPMIFDDTGGRIVGGRLDSRDPGGSLSYNGVVSRANLGFFGGLAFDALRSLRYHSMIVRLDGDLAGEFATRLTIDQVSLGQANGTQRLLKSVVKKVPFKFNVTIKGPFRSLIATAKSVSDPRNVIRDVLPVPIDQIPGVVTEVRNRQEGQTQTQTPVEQKIELTPPKSKRE